MKTRASLEQGTRHFSATLADLDVQAFLTDCQIRNLAPGTLKVYRRHLGDLAAWLHKPLAQATTDSLRGYFLTLRERRNPGGQHQAYRTLRRFYRWLEREGTISQNPMARISPPKVPEQTLEPVPLGDVRAMLKTCEGGGLLDLRDKALILTLLDTGARASELLAANLADFDPQGVILLRETKSKRPRAIFLGRRALRALLKYLAARRTADGPLWLAEDGGRLTYWGLRQVLRRRAEKAGVLAPSAHAFRRAFALQALRGGLDVVSLQRILGHADLSVINRYLKQTQADLQAAHAKASPVDRLLG